MPTKRPRYNITLDDDLLDRINRYPDEQNIESQNQAIIDSIINEALTEYLNEKNEVAIRAASEQDEFDLARQDCLALRFRFPR